MNLPSIETVTSPQSWESACIDTVRSTNFIRDISSSLYFSLPKETKLFRFQITLHVSLAIVEKCAKEEKAASGIIETHGEKERLLDDLITEMDEIDEAGKEGARKLAEKKWKGLMMTWELY